MERKVAHSPQRGRGKAAPVFLVLISKLMLSVIKYIVRPVAWTIYYSRRHSGWRDH